MTVSTHSSVNQSAATMSAALNVLRAALLTAGWTQVGSGDASTFSNSGTGPVTGGGSGAGGMDNTGAWVRLRDPGGVREMIFQRGASSASWSLFYSVGARFTGGSPSATVRPTATDEVTVFSAVNFSTTSPAYAHAIVEDTAINGVYGWWLVRTQQATSVRMDFIGCDPLSSGTDQSRYAVLGAAVDPCVWINFPSISTPALDPASLGTGNAAVAQILFAPNLSTRALLTICCLRDGLNDGSGNTMATGGATTPNGMAANDYDSGDDLVAVMYGRLNNQSNGNPGMLIGLSHHMSMKTIAARQYPDVVQHGSSDLAWLYYNTLGIPWPKGTVPSA